MRWLNLFSCENLHFVSALKTAFKQVDKDGSNAVEMNEFYELLKVLKRPEASDRASAEKLFKQIDTDNSGSLEFGELVQFFVKK